MRGLTNRFGSQTVHEDLDLDVRRGEILGVVGGSGTGKSVLMRSILGLREPDAGSIQVLGADARSGRFADRQHITRNTGVLFQDGALFSSMTVGENVQVPLKEHHGEFPERWYFELALLKIKLAGLPADALDKLPSQLSGGMRKRAGLARALALDPPLLFLDEPTAGLDPIGAAAFDRLIRTLQQALGLTVFLITHDLDTLYAICDRIAVLADRKVIANAPLAEVEQIDHPWIQDYFHGPRASCARPRPIPPRPPEHGNQSQLRPDRRLHHRGRPGPAAVRALGRQIFLRPHLAAVPGGVPRGGDRPVGRQPGAVQRHRGRLDHRVDPGAERPAAGGRACARQFDHADQERHPRQAGDHQPDRAVDHPALRRHPEAPALTTIDKSDAPIIQTTPSALQNITDTANRIVERMDQMLSDKNVASISATLQNLEKISGGIADRDEGMQALIVSARDAARNLDTTLTTTNGTIKRLDQNLVQQLPGILEKLDATLVKLDSAAGNADNILGENRAAINSFANDGLGQLGPTLTELRGLIRDLRRVSDKLDNNPARYLLGRDAPKEFEPK